VLDLLVLDLLLVLARLWPSPRLHVVVCAQTERKWMGEDGTSLSVAERVADEERVARMHTRIERGPTRCTGARRNEPGMATCGHT
jgi:hypothetical protein